MIVLEINEIPLAILRWHAEQDPHSAIAELLDSAVVGQTIASDEGVKELYPSQTWASLATGVPHDKHGVYWYGDPKPTEYPLYWQAAAQQRRVGIVGTLHSSPFEEQCEASGVVFAVPDVFGTTATTKPASLGPFQSFNQRMTNRNARAVSSTAPVADYAAGIRSLAGSGVRPRTLARLGTLAGLVAAGRVPKERLRTAQFLLMADVFEAQLRRTVPDLSVLFTNHVAAAMHRYWPASFPGDWDEPLHDDAWVSKHRDEISAALRELDRVIGRLLPWCRDTDTTMMLISSMGQVGGGQADDGGAKTLVVKDPAAFGSALGLEPDLELRSAMVPHLTYRFADEATAMVEADRLRCLTLAEGRLSIDRSVQSVTVTYHLDDLSGELVIDGFSHRLADAGLAWVEVTEHKAGTHHPLGSLVIANSPTATLPEEVVDYLDLAPAILRALGLPALAHHREPRFTL